MKHKILLISLLGLVIVLSGCTDYCKKGEIKNWTKNDTHDIVEYCNGTDWINFTQKIIPTGWSANWWESNWKYRNITITTTTIDFTSICGEVDEICPEEVRRTCELMKYEYGLCD